MSYYQKLIELTKRPFRKPPRRKRVCPECGSSGGMAYPNSHIVLTAAKKRRE